MVAEKLREEWMQFGASQKASRAEKDVAGTLRNRLEEFLGNLGKLTVLEQQAGSSRTVK
jgi:hypothetical protein